MARSARFPLDLVVLAIERRQPSMGDARGLNSQVERAENAQPDSPMDAELFARMRCYTQAVNPAAYRSSVGAKRIHFFACSVLLARTLTSLISLAAVTGCAVFDDESMTAGAVDLSPISVLLPRARVISAAEAHADQRATAFIFIVTGEEMLPRYAPGTTFVVEPTDYADLQRGMTVVLHRDSARMAQILIAQTADGWVTRALNSANKESDLMTRVNYLGTVVMAFSPETANPES